VGFDLQVRGVTPARVRRSLLRILRASPLCAVATVTPRGQAHIHTCYFAFSGELDLFFISHPASHHARNVEAGPSAAVAVFSSVQRWGGPDRGVQFFGTCGTVPASRRREAEATYAARFPRYARMPGSERLQLYRVRPRRLRLLDEREFGEGVFVEAAVRRTGPGELSNFPADRETGPKNRS
jgi:uncharacterized protein YhbP (UPF0306 family)